MVWRDGRGFSERCDQQDPEFQNRAAFNISREALGSRCLCRYHVNIYVAFSQKYLFYINKSNCLGVLKNFRKSWLFQLWHSLRIDIAS